MAFLTKMNDEQKRAAIAAIPAAQVSRIISRQCEGQRVWGMAYDEAMRATGADFKVQREPIQTVNGGRLCRDNVAAVNGSTGAVISVVSSTFGLVDHSAAAAPLARVCERGDAALAAIDLRDGGARFDATAVLGFSAVTRSGLDMPADGLAHFLRVSNAHDGSANVRLALSTFRLKCDNGMGFMQARGSERVRHTRNASVRMADWVSTILELIGYAEREVEQLQALADRPMDSSEFVEFASAWLLDVRGEPKTAAQRTSQLDDAVELERLFRGAAGTRSNLGRDRFDAINAVTEWLTPRREAYRDAARFASAYYQNETGARAKQRARAMRLLTR